MKLLGDYHTHTIYSRHNHGKGTVLENAQVAQQKGLYEIAITEHGFGHSRYGLKPKCVDFLRADIKKAKKETGVNVLYGIEANLMGMDGCIDLTREQEQQMDLVLMGFHKMAYSKSISDWWKLHVINSASQYLHFSKERIQKNTDAYLRALDKNNIDIVTHLGYGMPVDCVQIAALAKQTNTYIELNGKRLFFTPEEVERLIVLKTKFLINSDAHRPIRVGECNLPTNFAIMNNIPTELICNINQIPHFKNHK